MNKWALMSAALLLSVPTWANTYFGGFEDSVTTQNQASDYDYNDLVFSISSQNLTLVSNGNWYSKPTLGTNGTPYWNTHSFDGPNLNAGYCVYGGGNCGTGAGLDPSAVYLASGDHQSANDVYFSASDLIEGHVDAKFANDHNLLGWYNLSTPDQINWLAGSGTPGASFQFTPNGDFGLVGTNGLGQNFYSQTAYGTSDTVSHFAYFDPVAPEPGQAGLLAVGLAALGLLLRKRIVAVKRPA